MAKILLVDDEEIVLKSVSALLVGEGHETAMFTDVPSALEAFDADEFDLIITDIRMAPVDGMELIRTIRKDYPDFPIVVISAYTSDRIKDEGYRLGCNIYLSKPFRVDDVLNAVETSLKK